MKRHSLASRQIPMTVTIKAGANGRIDSQAIPFKGQADFIFSAAKISLSNSTSGTAHNIGIYIRVAASTETVAQLEADELGDNSSGVAGDYDLAFSELEDNVDYELFVSGNDFLPNDMVTVQVAIWELETDLAMVSDAVLNAAANITESPATSDTNAVAFGISEASIASILQVFAATWPEYKIGVTPYLTMSPVLGGANGTDDPVPAEFPHPPEAAIDTNSGAVVLTGTLVLRFYKTATNPLTDVVAWAYLGVELTTMPAMVTTSKTVLQLQLQSVAIKVASQIVYIDQSEILKGYPNLSTFEADVATFLDAITKQTGDFKTLLPFYVQTRPLPDYWNRTQYFTASFSHFDPRSVQTYGVAVGYLYAVFTVQAQDISVPCYCQSSAATRRKAASITASDMASLRRESMDQRVAAIAAWTPPPYKDIRTAASIFAFAITEGALTEIAKPYATKLGDKKDFDAGGAVYAHASYWYSANLLAIGVTDDGIEADLTFAAQGRAEAGVRDKCGDSVDVASLQISIDVGATAIAWTIAIQCNVPRQGDGCFLNATPSVKLGDVKVTFDIEPPPDPFPRVTLDIQGIPKIWMSDSVNREIREKATIRFFKSQIVQTGTFELTFVESWFLKGEAVVIGAVLHVTVPG